MDRRSRHRARPLGGAALAALVASACNWVSLAKNSLTYRDIQRGEAANLAVFDALIYATRAQDGLAIVGAGSGTTLATLPPPAGSESVDDVATAGNLLFVLDARAPGHLSVYSVADPLQPRLVTPPRAVPVGPFSGVSANAGLCIVSGGTSELTAWRYDSAGTLTGPVATADLGRGQPDVLVAHDGTLAYVSTHYRGPYFGLSVVRYDSAAGQLEPLAELELDGAGFTTGGAKPANFPIEAAVLGHDTVLVGHARGVTVIGTADPRRPAALATIDVGGPAVNVDVLDHVAAVAVSGSAPAVVLLELSGREARTIKRIPLAPGTLPLGVALTPARIAVAARDRGVLVLER